MKLIGLILFIYTFIVFPSATHAACIDPSKGVQIGDCFGFGNFTSFGQLVSKIVNPIFSIATVAVVIYFLFGAFKWMSSGGNKENIASARLMITHAIIGFIILMFAFFILEFFPQFFDLKGLYIIR